MNRGRLGPTGVDCPKRHSRERTLCVKVTAQRMRGPRLHLAHLVHTPRSRDNIWEIHVMKLLKAGVVAATVLFVSPVFAQDKPADNMQILMDKVKADKKLLVANNMKLTEEEAKGFWPIYESYQKDLQQLNGRLEKAIKAYADAYNKGTVPDATAKQLLDEALAIEDAEVKLKRSYVPKLEKVLPVSKIARYLQIETKVRSAIKYELARSIPLVE
jgi:hypothetical protein